MISIPHFVTPKVAGKAISSSSHFGSDGSTTAIIDRPATPDLRGSIYVQEFADDELNDSDFQPFADIPETPDKWLDDPQPLGDPQRQPATTPATAPVETAITDLATSILQRFPLAAPTVLLFVGSDNNPHVDSTSSQIAELLAECNIGKVLLIDSNPVGALSGDFGMARTPGLTDVLSSQEDWNALIANQEIANLDFLAAGTDAWDRWGSEQQLRRLAAELKQSYQFVCVSGGDAHSATTKFWSGVCDGSYVLVSLKNSNQAIAESAVTELRTCGARLLGCVVTDAA